MLYNLKIPKIVGIIIQPTFLEPRILQYNIKLIKQPRVMNPLTQSTYLWNYLKNLN